MPNLQRGGLCLNFAHFSMQFCNPGDPKGGPWPNGPPLNTPLGTGAQEVYPSLDQMNKVKTKNLEGFLAAIRN